MSDATFFKADSMTGRNEGGWVNNPNDAGGETYAGITRKYYPNWEGWAFLDTIKDKHTNQRFLNLEKSVQYFYRDNYWNKFHLGQINNEMLACCVYDFLITSDNDAIKSLQHCLGILEDGIIGAVTLEHINDPHYDQFALLASYVRQRISFYTDLAIRDKRNREFYKSWMNRCVKYS